MVKEKLIPTINLKENNLIKTLIILSTIVLLSWTSSEKITKGTATYYGQYWTGRLTSSGERFHKDSLTAAHKHYKFGTIVKVINLRNDSIVYVKINDRLPKSSKHIIDLSYGTAKQLNFLRGGVVPVTLEPIDTVQIKK
jgi:rare lipoprotein A